MFHESEDWFFDDDDQFPGHREAVINRMVEKLKRQGRIVEGAHGTSAVRARIIMENGFEDYTCVERSFGVHFHDIEYEGNAHGHGRTKAKKEGDSEYAIITAKLFDPSPDFLMGRPQWLVLAKNIEILGVSYFSVPNVRSSLDELLKKSPACAGDVF
jgi:hypothetical protein